MKQVQYIKAVSVAIILFVAACSPKVENRGYVKQNDWKDTVVIGKTSKQEVLEKFGSPSAQSSFGAETWYYVSSRKEAIGFLRPEIVEQEAVDISFDQSGIVSSINLYNKNNSKKFDLVKRTTPTEGHSLTFIDQTLGNLGRFNKPGRDGYSSGHRSAGRGDF